MDGERAHRDPVVPVHDTGADLVDIDGVGLGVTVLEAVDADVDVLPPRGEQVRGHLLEPVGAVGDQRCLPVEHSGAEDQIRVAQRVIGV